MPSLKLSIQCFSYNIQETMLVSKHYNRLAAILPSPVIENHQYQELNQDVNFSIFVSVVWELLSLEISDTSGSGSITQSQSNFPQQQGSTSQ